MPVSRYVAGLRALVGTSMLHMPTAAVLCRDEQGRILLVRQGDSGRWTTPGGAIEPGESPELAAAREAREEAGVVVKIVGLRRAVGGPEYRTTYANGDVLSYVALIYDGVVIDGEPTADGDETIDVGWFSVADIADLSKDEFLTLLLRDGIVE
jgi:ADP-ribose pyrophosphatase YjhB (NUDIX family)